ncbi:hypothetical protein EON65_08025 [archaeon]|nr:MAG: hypothetical protein EON65_08025 [archaeon]
MIPSDYKAAFEKFLSDYLRDSMSIDLVVAEDMTGIAFIPSLIPPYTLHHIPYTIYHTPYPVVAISSPSF